MQERRHVPRLKLRHKVGVMLSSGEVVYLWTFDLSQGGMQLLSEYPADLGTNLRIFFSALDPKVDDYVRLVADVHVIHCLYDGTTESFRVGVEFSSFEGDGAAVYARFLDARLFSRYGQHLGAS